VPSMHDHWLNSFILAKSESKSSTHLIRHLFVENNNSVTLEVLLKLLANLTKGARGATCLGDAQNRQADFLSVVQDSVAFNVKLNGSLAPFDDYGYFSWYKSQKHANFN
jgi:hypothetical protein